MPDANNAQKRISIEQGDSLTVGQLVDFLQSVPRDLEVAVLKPRTGLNDEIYPPEMFKISRIEENYNWAMLDMRVEKVIGGE